MSLIPKALPLFGTSYGRLQAGMWY